MTKEEFKKAVNAVLPDALKIKLQAIPTPVAAAAPPAPPSPPAAPAPPAVAPYMANVTGGQPMYVDISDDGLPGVDQGDMVYSDTGLTMPYADGTYTLDDGSSVTVAGGKVTVYTAAASPSPALPATMKAEFAAQKTEFAAVLTKFAAIEKESKEQKAAIAELITINATFAEAFKALTETPVDDKPKGTEAKFSKQITKAEFQKLESWDKAAYKTVWGTPSK